MIKLPKFTSFTCLEAVMCIAAAASQEEMKQMLNKVIASEENRLAMGRALIDAQLENNSTAQAAEQKQYFLEQRILELEGRLAQESEVQVSY
jgi:septum formation inhibitor MinC